MYSTTLTDVRTGKTRLERSFDADAVRTLKEAADHDLSIGGPHLAGQALRAGLVDELGLLVVPAVVGGGTPWLPTGVRLRLETARRAPVRQRRPSTSATASRTRAPAAGGRGGQSGEGADGVPLLRRRSTCRTTLSSSSLSSLARPR